MPNQYPNSSNEPTQVNADEAALLSSISTNPIDVNQEPQNNINATTFPPQNSGSSDNNSIKTKKSHAKTIVASILGILLLAGSVGAGTFLVKQRQDIREKAASCGTGCGNEPSPLPNFNPPPSIIGPFNESGNLVIYYAVLGSGGSRTITLEKSGKTYEINTSNFNERGKKERILTDIKIEKNDTIRLVNIKENVTHSNQDCAPVKGPPFYSLGWSNPNSDNTCGSDLPGPPSQCIPFEKISISSFVDWARGFGKEIVSTQCWADWREWPGDYDFNDFLLMFSVEGGQETEGVCRETRIYKVQGDINNPDNWKKLTTDEIGNLKPGDEIYLVAVASGNTTPPNGGIEKARFIVNQKATEETKSVKPKKSTDNPNEWEFYLKYQIPEDITEETSFSVKGEIYFNGSWL